ncbi:hypothetical protein AB0G02_18650 [Actinosynnema sp. NPDC023658]|uniref:hypothetical protein n=1 Tax=Actinosynnema sp. NPDC023658 TaxID=3155465 RepID=UPI0033F3FC5D
MFKKAGAVAIAAAGLMLLGSPAFATPHSEDFGDDYTAVGEFHNYYDAEAPGGDYADQFGLINFGNDSDLLSNINICETEVNVIAIPILSQNDESLCINTDDDGNSDTGQNLHD